MKTFAISELFAVTPSQAVQAGATETNASAGDRFAEVVTEGERKDRTLRDTGKTNRAADDHADDEQTSDEDLAEAGQFPPQMPTVPLASTAELPAFGDAEVVPDAIPAPVVPASGSLLDDQSLDATVEDQPSDLSGSAEFVETSDFVAAQGGSDSAQSQQFATADSPVKREGPLAESLPAGTEDLVPKPVLAGSEQVAIAGGSPDMADPKVPTTATTEAIARDHAATGVATQNLSPDSHQDKLKAKGASDSAAAPSLFTSRQIDKDAAAEAKSEADATAADQVEPSATAINATSQENVAIQSDAVISRHETTGTSAHNITAVYGAATIATSKMTGAHSAYAGDPGAMAQNISRQIGQAIATKSDDKIELTLTPAELGRVRLTMHHGSDGAVSVVVQADRAETLELMRRHADVLVRDFREQGYSGINLSFGNASGGGSDKDSPPSSGSLVEELTLIETQTSPKPILSTASGGLDLRM